MIPINPDTVNPVITRKEFAYWICKVFNLSNAPSDIEINRYASYYLCVNLGIISPARGMDDVFSGIELLDSFSYLDYYVKHFKIKPKEGVLEVAKTEYDDLPEWRKILYKELDEQRAMEKKVKENIRNINKVKKIKDSDGNDSNTDGKDSKIREKFIDGDGSGKL